MDDAFDLENLRWISTMSRPGDIRSRQAYQQGKMLQNSGWHDVPINMEIDTMKDIRSFSVMFYLAGAIGICAPRDGTEWVPFVKRFYSGDPFNDYLSVGDFL